jgi:predicted HTH domain antitoxin
MDVKTPPPVSEVGDPKLILWPAELQLMLRLGHWTTPDQLLAEALEALLAAHPSLRESVAVELFQQQLISLARAAELAGTDQWTFRDVLQMRNVPLVVEAPDTATMDESIRTYTRRNM